MKQENTDRMFDQRVVRRNISTGRISTDDYGRFLSALTDVGGNIKPRVEGGDNDGYDESPPEEAAAAPAGDAAAGFGSAPAAMPRMAPTPAVAPVAAPVAPVATPPAVAPVATPPVSAAPAASPPPVAPAPPAPAPEPASNPFSDSGTEPPSGD